MKAAKILILGMFLWIGAMAQTVTPNPGPYQPVSTKFQYTWLKFIGGIWNAGKLVQDDTAYFSGLVYVPTALQADSNTRAANTSWVKKWIADNVSPGVPGEPASSWATVGNYAPSDPNPYRLGMKDSMPLYMITNDQIRLIIPDNGIKRSSGIANKVLMIDTITKNVHYTDMGGGGASDLQTVTDIGNTTTNNIILQGTDPNLTLKQDVSTKEYQLRVGIGTGVANNSWNLYDASANKLIMQSIGTRGIGIGNYSSGWYNSSILQVRGGSNGANIDAQADSTISDEGNIEIMASDYSDGKGIAMRGWGNVGIGGSNIFSYSKRNLGVLDFHNDFNIIRVLGNRSLRFGTNDTERMLLDSTGNLTIGSASAGTEKLNILGSIKITDGTEGIGKILVSDADGKGTWTTPTSGGTVTSVGSGYGLSGGPITTTGTLFVDTSAVGGIGSKTYIQNYLALYLKLVDTSGMLSPYLRSGTAAATYQPIGSYVSTMAAIGSSPNANGATISGSTLTLQPASASFGGILTTGAQTIPGTKTMSGAGFTVSGAMNVSGSFRSTSVAITSLGITPPAGQLTLLGSNERIIFTTSSTGTNSGQILIGVPVASGDLVFQTTPSWNAFDGTERVRLVNSTGNFLIGTATDVASSTLTVESTTKGVLFPRMTTTQKNAISSPAEGLVVYDTTLHKLCVYTGSAWETVTSL